MGVENISPMDVLKKYKGYRDGDFENESRAGSAIQWIKARCPFPGHSSGGENFKISVHNDGTYYYECFSGNGKHSHVKGDALTLVIGLGLADNTTKAQELLENDFGLKPPDEWNVRIFAERKGLNWELLANTLMWETDHRGLVMPYFDDDGNVVTRRIRKHNKFITSDNDNRFYYDEGSDTNNALYLSHTLKSAEKTDVYITEGESDCVTLHQAGFTVVGVPSCTAWNPHYSDKLATFQRIFIVADNDEAGQKLIDTVAKDLGDKLYLVKMPGKVKDVNDLHTKSCRGDVDKFRQVFSQLLVLPVTKESFITMAKTNKDFIKDTRTWELMRSVIANPINRDEFIAELAKVTGYGKGVLFEMSTAARKQVQNLPEWYTITRNGIMLNPRTYAQHIAESFPILRIKDVWYLYFPDNGVYHMVEDAYINNIVIENLIDECREDPKNIRDTFFFLNNDPRLIVKPEEFDRDPFLLNVKNGVLDIKTMTLHPHSPAYKSLVQLNVNYNPETPPSALFNEYLENKLPEPDTRAVTQELLGYAISNFQNAEKWFLIHGGGRSGKGTLLHIIEQVIGEDNCSHVPLQKLADRFETANMFGKLVNIEADLSREPIKEASVKILKSLVGRDTVSGEFKNKQSFDFKNKARLIFACNDLPPNTGDNKKASFWEKLIIVSMNNSDTENVRTTFKDELVQQENLDYIFLWALEGLKRLISRDFTFSQCDASDELKEVYKVESSSALQFIDECCTIGEGYYCSSAEFSKAYAAWCEENNKHPKSIQNALSDASEFYDAKYIKKVKTRKLTSDVNPRAYVEGLKIISEF